MSINQQVKKLSNSNDMTENFSSKKKVGKSRVGLVEKCRRGFTTLQPIPKEIYWMTQDQTQHKIANCLHHLLPITRKKRKQHTHKYTHKKKEKKSNEKKKKKKKSF